MDVRGKDKIIGSLLFSGGLNFVMAILILIHSAILVSGQGLAQISANNSSSTESAPSQSRRQRSPIAFDKGTTEYGIWGGTSYDAPDLSQSRGVKVPLLAGLRYGRIIYTKKSFDDVMAKGQRNLTPALPFCHVTLSDKKPKPAAYPTVLNTLGDQLRARRLDLGLLQKDVAAIIGVTEDTVCYWENGRVKPSQRSLAWIIEFLNGVSK